MDDWNEFCKRSQLAEDTVEYKLYPINSANASVESLDRILESCLDIAKRETCRYVWNSGCFNLRTVKPDQNSPFLYGLTKFDDCVDDEWFIVYLLHKITSVHKDLVAMANDSDGEFLLIEAAEHIPRWLNCENSTNRVFIYCGYLHIIPLPSSPAEIITFPVTTPTLDQALQLLLSKPTRTAASKSVCSCLQERIGQFPTKAFENTFFGNIQIPESLVSLLDSHPNFISKSVQAVCSRDIIDMSLHRKAKFSIPGEHVWSQIPMTRNHYAQLINMEVKNPSLSVAKCPPADRKGCELGRKIQLGFEILCAKEFYKQQNAASDDVDCDGKRFVTYLESLKTNGYFKDEIEGSKMYKKLLKTAKESFATMVHTENLLERSSSKDIFTFLQQWNAKTEKLKFLVKKQNRSDLPEESSDKFMNLNEEDIEKMVDRMNKGFKNLNSKHKKNFDLEEEIKNVSTKVDSFVNSSSGYEGVELDETNDPVEINPEKFMLYLENMLGNKNDDESFSDEFLTSDSDAESSNENEMTDYFKAMQEELEKTNVTPNTDSVDIDKNLVKNFLVSCESEDANLSGASSVLLASLDMK